MASQDRGHGEPQVHDIFCATSWSNFRKSGRHCSSYGLLPTVTFSSSCRGNPYWRGDGHCLLCSLVGWEYFSAYLCENCLNTVTLPTCISPASSSVKQETQPPNLNTRQVAWKMKINFPIQKPCASVIENLSLSEWELLSSLLVICFCFSFLVEKFSRVFFKLSSLAKHWLKLKRELGVGSEAALDLFLVGGGGGQVADTAKIRQNIWNFWLCTSQMPLLEIA